MAIIKCLSAKSQVGYILRYVQDKEKTEDKIISGINCNPETAKEEMRFTKELHDKTEGRQYYHVIQSFKPGEVEAEKAHEIGKEFASTKFENYEVVICTHVDKEHIHNHIIINSVNKETGMMYHSTKHDLRELKQENNRICEREGLSVPEHKKNRYFTMAEIKTAEKGESLKFRLMNDIDMAKEKSTSKEGFIKQMEQKGYEVNWTDNRKYITYTMPEGNKFRDRSLPGEYSKEVMENGYRGIEKEERQSREQGYERESGRSIDKDFKQFFGSERSNDELESKSNDRNRELHTGKEPDGELERTGRNRQESITGSNKELWGTFEADKNRERDIDKQSDKQYKGRTGQTKPRIERGREQVSGYSSRDKGRTGEDKGTGKAKLERGINAYDKGSNILSGGNNNPDHFVESVVDSKVQRRGKDGGSSYEHTDPNYSDDAAAKAKQINKEIIDTVARDLPVKEVKQEKQREKSRGRDDGEELELYRGR